MRKTLILIFILVGLVLIPLSGADTQEWVRNMIHCSKVYGATSDICTLVAGVGSSAMEGTHPWLTNTSTHLIFNESELDAWATINIINSTPWNRTGENVILANPQDHVFVSNLSMGGGEITNVSYIRTYGMSGDPGYLSYIASLVATQSMVLYSADVAVSGVTLTLYGTQGLEYDSYGVSMPFFSEDDDWADLGKDDKRWRNLFLSRNLTAGNITTECIDINGSYICDWTELDLGGASGTGNTTEDFSDIFQNRTNCNTTEDFSDTFQNRTNCNTTEDFADTFANRTLYTTTIDYVSNNDTMVAYTLGLITAIGDWNTASEFYYNKTEADAFGNWNLASEFYYNKTEIDNISSSIDGGSANSVYLDTQKIDGGTA